MNKQILRMTCGCFFAACNINPVSAEVSAEVRTTHQTFVYILLQAADRHGNRIEAFRVGVGGHLTQIDSGALVTETAIRLVASPNGKYLYEEGSADRDGTPGQSYLITYQIMDDGKIRTIDRWAAKGSHLSFHPSGRSAYITSGSYGSGFGEILTFRCSATGALVASHLPEAECGSSPSSVVFNALGTSAYVADLVGERLWRYSVSKNGELVSRRPVYMKIGNWVNEVLVTPDGSHVYVATSKPSAIYQFVISAGVCTPLAPISIPKDTILNMLASKSGKVVYASTGRYIIALERKSNGSLGRCSRITVNSSTSNMAMDTRRGVFYALTDKGIRAFRPNSSTAALQATGGLPAPVGANVAQIVVVQR